MEEYRITITPGNLLLISDADENVLFRRRLRSRENVDAIIARELGRIMDGPAQLFLPGYPWSDKC